MDDKQSFVATDFNKLDAKKKKFCEAFIATGVIKQAAEAAGFIGRNASQVGTKYMKDKECQSYICYLQSLNTKQAIADASEIQATLSSMLRGEIDDSIVTPRGDVVKARIHSRERIKAADVLAAIQGLKTDNVHLMADKVINISDDLTK